MAAGLGYQIWRAAARELDEKGNAVANAIDPNAGFKICVEKTQNPGAKYPSYNLRVGRIPSPMGPILETMSQEEVDVLRPLENVVHQLTEEEQWQCLEATMAKETVAEIRSQVSIR
jgi:hypothetical protein